jgi:ABC-type sugar transport system ATPase subunit
LSEIRVENLTKSYGSVKALKDVSFICKDGEFLTIIGPTGAGKTTIINCIAGIVKPDSGKVFSDNKEITNLIIQERNLAMAFENYSLYPHFTVYQNIGFPLQAPTRKNLLTKEEKKRRIEEVIKLLGIEHLVDKMPAQLSGGQKQRVSLGRALVRRPIAFLLDEPLAHLDAKLKVSLRSEFKEIAEKWGTTTIYITHDFKEALAISDRIAVIREGVIQQIGTPEEIYGTPENDFVGSMIGDPPMNLIDGRISIEGSKIRFLKEEVFDIMLPSFLKEKVLEKMSNENLRIGVRPSSVQISDKKVDENAFESNVFAVEHTHSNSLVTFKIGPDEFIQAMTPQRLSCTINQKFWVKFLEKGIHIFEKTI